MHDKKDLNEEPPLTKEAWPANPIETYKCIKSGEWGYLLMYSDGKFKFLHERPTDEEIIERWGKYFR